MSTLRLRLRVVSGLLIACGLFDTPTAAAEPIPRTDLTIRTYNLVGLPTRHLHAAQRTTESIFETAGVTIAGWRDCQSHDRASAAPAGDCPDGVRPNEVVIRIVRTPPSGPNRWVLGFSYVAPHAGRSWLSTVFADHIAATASRFHLDPGTLLGLTVAHEVGHLLLANTSHPDRGLMRANWHSTSLRRHVRTDWLFSRSEASQMRADLIARSRASAEAIG